ncbi:MAG: GTP cyclohydrolase I FolE [Hyphomicrobiales bacterium]
MDNVIEPSVCPGSEHDVSGKIASPSRQDAENAVRTLIAWAGDDPKREGLIDTPGRVAAIYREFFCGYAEDPIAVLSRTFEDVGGYDDVVMLRDIEVNSHCEHHMVPIIGRAHIAYFPQKQVVGLSKLARVVDIYAHRLQTQETMTAQIAKAIDGALAPKGVAVMIDALHQCMSIRGVRKPNATTVTTRFLGVFKADPNLQTRFFDLIRCGNDR